VECKWVTGIAKKGIIPALFGKISARYILFAGDEVAHRATLL
jgi:hypothetical protein